LEPLQQSARQAGYDLDVGAIQVCHGIAALLDVRGAALVSQRCGVHMSQYL
jgi:hypothetical protein